MKKFILISIITTILFSCDSDDDGPLLTPSQPSTAYPVKLHIHHKAGAASFALNTDYSHSGTNIQFTRASFYLSNFDLKIGTRDLLPTKNILFVSPDVMHYDLGTIADSGAFTSFHMNVGVDSITNTTKEPAQYAANEPLGPKNPSHYWTWNSGWVFLIMEGKVDANMNGTYDNDPSEQFIFHIGLNKFLGQAHLMGNYSINSTTANTVHMEVDYLKFLTNVDLKTENSTHSMGTADKIALAQKVHNNMGSAFSLQ